MASPWKCLQLLALFLAVAGCEAMKAYITPALKTACSTSMLADPPVAVDHVLKLCLVSSFSACVLGLESLPVRLPSRPSAKLVHCRMPRRKHTFVTGMSATVSTGGHRLFFAPFLSLWLGLHAKSSYFSKSKVRRTTPRPSPSTSAHLSLQLADNLPNVPLMRRGYAHPAFGLEVSPL